MKKVEREFEAGDINSKQSALADIQKGYPKVGEYINGKKVLRVVPIRAFFATVENDTGETDELIGFEDFDGAFTQRVKQV